MPLPELAATALFALAGNHVLLTLAASRSDRIERWVTGPTTPLVRDGYAVEAGLRRERLSRRTLGELLRLRGYGSGDQHELARVDLEAGGGASLQPRPQARQLRRRDLSAPAPAKGKDSR